MLNHDDNFKVSLFLIWHSICHWSLMKAYSRYSTMFLAF